jgi:hypothetical protein
MNVRTNLLVERRQAIFKALVEAQDRGLSPLQSRMAVAEQFEVTAGQVKRIEQEGLDRQWPPLAD